MRSTRPSSASSRAAIRPGAEDAGGRPARRRRGARFQQRAAGHHRLFGPAARQPPADRSRLPGHHADQAEREPGGEPGAPAARLLAPPDPAPGGAHLGDVLSDLSMLLKRLLGERVELDLRHGRDLWPVKADVNQFEQVVVNLAVNARDAMPDGGKLTDPHRQRRGGRRGESSISRGMPPPTTCCSRSPTPAPAFRRT
jgi:hypothetical protein